MEQFTDTGTARAYDARLIKRLWAFVRPYRGLFWLSLVALPVASGFMLAQPYLLKVAIDGYVASRDAAGLTLMALVYLGLLLGEFAASACQYYLTMVVAQRSLADLRVRLFEHLQRLPVRYFDSQPVGRLVTRVTSDVDVLNEMFSAGALTIVMDVLALAGIVVILVRLDWRLALVSLSVLPAIVLAINAFRLRARKVYRAIRERLARINGYLQEAITGAAVVQLFRREGRVYGEFERLNAAHRDANHLSNIYEAALFSLAEAAGSICYALIVWYGGGRIVQGALEFGTLVAFIEYIQRFFIPIRDFSAKYTVMQAAMASAERVFQLLDTATEAPAVMPSRRPAAARGAVEFEGVWFAYKEGDYVLRDVSFRVAPGETVAVVGATGAGKTTLVKLLARFYEPIRGRILVDGIDVREWDPEEFRRRIAVVLQDPFLFSGNVSRNITLGRSAVSREAVEHSARAVNADRFIRRLPGGYRGTVGERGNNLSTGERQLLTFARALAGDPRLLVLDEATANVDPETERLVQDAVGKLMAGCTSLVVAHRLSTIEKADRIVVMHRGEVRESGTHSELLAKGKIYRRLYHLQFAPLAAPLAQAREASRA